MMMPSLFTENLFDDFFNDFDEDFFGKKNPLYGKHARNMMKTDVRETDDSYEVDIDLPGFKKDEVNAQLHDGYITISAAKGLDKDEKDKKTGKYIRRERYAGSMRSSRKIFMQSLRMVSCSCQFRRRKQKPLRRITTLPLNNL